MRLLWAMGAWVAGLVAGIYIGPPLGAAVGLLGSAVVLGAGLWLTRRPVVPAVLAALFLLGLLRVGVEGDEAVLGPGDAGETVKLRGKIDADPEEKARTLQFVFKASEVDRGRGWEQADEKLMVWARPAAALVRERGERPFRYGDRLLLEGRLSEPEAFQGFDYREYLARQGIRLNMLLPKATLLAEGEGNPVLSGVYQLRGRLSDSLARSLPEPQASVGQAMLLGRRGSLPSDVRDEFRDTGTSHLLAISGLHVGVLLALSLGAVTQVLGRRSQYYLLAPLALVWGYALLSGLSPSVLRAAVMGSVYLAALGLGRPRSVLPALSLAAGVMAAVDPGVVREASFQLSFVAVAGIAALAPPMLDGLRWLLRTPLTGRGPGWWLLQGAMLAAVVSLAATLATLPLVAFNFHQLPMLGIPATVLALPAIPLILVMSLLTAVGGVIYAPLGEVVGWVAWFPLSYLIGLVELVSRVPGSTVAVPRFSGALVWGYYGVAALLVLAPSLFRWRPRLPEASESRRPGEGIHVPRRWQVAGALALAFFAASAWYRAVPHGDGRLHVSFLDVGQGDSIFIETPQGRRMLIDGGPERLEAARALDGRLPFWDRKVDVVMATHADEDHLLGLVEVVRRRPVGAAIRGQDDSALGLRWDRALEKAGLEFLEVERGQIISLEESVRLEVLHPSPEWLAAGDRSRNNGSTVVRVTYGEVSFLLASDVEAEAERVMIVAGVGLDSTVLKVAHHGSKTSTTVGFLGEVMPQVAVVQVGEGNQFGHPHPEVMERLNGLVGPGRVYTTAESGTLEFITDGRRLWVREAK